MSQNLSLKVDLTAADYVAHDFHSFFGKGRRSRAVLMIGAYIIIFFALVLATLKYWYLLPLSAIVIFYPLLLRYMAIYRFNSYKTRKLRENLNYTISNKSLKIKGESFSKTFNWDELKEKTEGRKAFYFWETDSFAIVLPKRYLSKADKFFVREVVGIK